MQTFLLKLADNLQCDQATAGQIVEQISSAIEARLAEGELYVFEDFGTFERLNHSTFFRPVRDLQEAVNHRFAGLDVIDVANESAAASRQPRFRDRPPELPSQVDEATAATSSTLRLVTDSDYVDSDQEVQGELEEADVEEWKGDSTETVVPQDESSFDDVEFPDDADAVIDSIEKLDGPADEGLADAIHTEGVALETVGAEEVVPESEAPESLPDLEPPVHASSDDEVQEVPDLSDEDAVAEDTSVEHVTYSSHQIEETVEPEETTPQVPATETSPPKSIPRTPLMPSDPAEYVRELEDANRPSISRIAVPVIAILGIVGIMLWFLNRSLKTGSTEQTPTAEQVETRAATEVSPPDQTDNAEVASGGVSQEATAEVTPSQPDVPPAEVPATTEETSSEWNPGSFDRDAAGYTIIVSSEPSRSEAFNVARGIATQLSESDLNVDVLRVDVNGEVRFRVGVGQFASLAVAKSTLNSLQSGLPDGSWITSITSDM